jgi:hypothetical protein
MQTGVGIATGYWLDGPISIPGLQDSSPLHSLQTGSGAHLDSYAIGSGGDFTGVERKGSEADHSPLSTAEVKKGGAIPPLHSA